MKQDLLLQKKHVVGKVQTMGLGYAIDFPTCALTEACMHFGIHFIQLKGLVGLLFAK